LLLLNHALADHLIHRGLCEGGRNLALRYSLWVGC
jgi:hypothetical protein